MRPRYVSIPFGEGKMTEDIPKGLLSTPNFSRINNLIYKKMGNCQSINHYKKEIRVPTTLQIGGRRVPVGDVLKLFTFNKALFCITENFYLIYNKGQGTFRPFEIRKNKLSTRIFPIAQKERDLKHLTFVRLNANLVILYSYNNIVFYKIFSLESDNERLVGEERRLLFDYTGTIRQMYAYEENNIIWITIATDRGVSVEPNRLTFKEDPTDPDEMGTETPERGASGFWNLDAESSVATLNTLNYADTQVNSLVMVKNRLYYDNGGTFQERTYNTQGTDPAPEERLTNINQLPNPSANAVSLAGGTLYDFKKWCDFMYDNEPYRVVWSVQSGFFILNNRNRLVAHYLSNFVPLQASDPPRMSYMGATTEYQGKIYFPILRSGLEVDEQLSDANTIIRPLGVELICLDFNGDIETGFSIPENLPEVSRIANQMLISGPILSYSDGQTIVEHGFTEKPVIKKSPLIDYDRWDYQDIAVNAPTFGNISNLDVAGFGATQKKLVSPYNVKSVDMTARTSSGNVGGFSNSDFTGTTADRRLRYSTTAQAETIETSYGTNGTLSKVYYDNTNKRIVFEFTGPPATLTDGLDHPLAVLVNDGTSNVVYEVMSSETIGGVRHSYHYRETSPFISGSKYAIIVLKTERLKSFDLQGNELDRTITYTNNLDQEITYNVQDLSLRKNEQITLDTQDDTREKQRLNNSTFDFGEIFSTTTTTQPPDTTGPVTPVFRDQFTRSLPSGARDTYQVFGQNVLYGLSGNRYQAMNFTTGIVGTASSRISDFEHMYVHGNNLYVLTAEAVYKYNISTGSLLASRSLSRREWNLFRISANNDYVIVAGYNISADSFRDYYSAFIRFDTNLGSRYTVYRTSLTTSNVRNMKMNNNYLFFNQTSNSTINRLSVTSLNSTPRSYSINFNTFAVNDNNLFTISGSTLRRNSLSGSSIDTTTLKNSYDNNSLAGATNNGLSIFKDGNQERYNLQGTITPAPVQTTVTSQGFIKSNYRAILGLGTDYKAGGTLERPTFVNPVEPIEITGFYKERNTSNVYMYFSSAKSNYLGGISAFKTAVANAIRDFVFVKSSSERPKLVHSNIPSGDITSLPEVSNTFTIRYNLKAFYGANQLFKDYISDLEGGQQKTLEIINVTGRISTERIEPIGQPVFSGVFESTKELTRDDIRTGIRVTDRNEEDAVDITLAPSTFFKITGPTSGRHYYYQKTSGRLIINNAVFNFDEVVPVINYQIALVPVAPSDSALKRLLAYVYHYRCRFKWLDNNGIEHRSQWSNEVSIFCNSPIAESSNNRPTFDINNLHLTNKPFDSIFIEVYRTSNTNRVGGEKVFKLVKEVVNLSTETQRIKDDVIGDDRRPENDQRGQTETPDTTLISGAKNVIHYKNRWVLYGFPERPERIMVSSPRRAFTNQAINFKRQNRAGDAIEILMNDPIKSIDNMDQYLTIHTDNNVFVWQISESGVQQQSPEEVTGLKEFNTKNSQSTINVMDGVMFLSDKGIWMITRNLKARNIGEDVQDTYGKSTKIYSMTNLKEEEEMRIVRENIDPDPDETNCDRPLCIDVFNYKFMKWASSDKPGQPIHAINWNDKYTVLNKEREIWVSQDQRDFDTERVKLIASNAFDPDSGRREFKIQTGWVNFQALQNYFRFWDVIVLGKFRALDYVKILFEYDYIKNEIDKGKLEPEIPQPNYYKKTPSNIRNYVDDELIQIRFRPNRISCSSVRITLEARAEYAEFDSIRLGYTVSETQRHLR